MMPFFTPRCHLPGRLHALVCLNCAFVTYSKKCHTLWALLLRSDSLPESRAAAVSSNL